MKIIAITFLFNILCIFIFAFIYTFIEQNNFLPLVQNNKLTFIDFLFYSTTIQSGVGLSNITPISSFSKILSMIQHIILLASSVIILRYIVHKKVF
jgi:uncharacterized membrane protein